MLTIKRMTTLLGFLITLGFAAWAATDSTTGSIITSQNLGGDERFLIYASTDKPIYREQEFVYLRAVFLNAADNTPVKNGQISIKVKIRGPKGDFVFERNHRANSGLLTSAFSSALSSSFSVNLCFAIFMLNRSWYLETLMRGHRGFERTDS